MRCPPRSLLPSPASTARPAAARLAASPRAATDAAAAINLAGQVLCQAARSVAAEVSGYLFAAKNPPEVTVLGLGTPNGKGLGGSSSPQTAVRTLKSGTFGAKSPAFSS